MNKLINFILTQRLLVVMAFVVLTVAGLFAILGITGIGLADTTGRGNPKQVLEIAQAARARYPQVDFALHFHNTRGTGLANVAVALECGVRSFDASLAGLGGCPFAPGATGNIVMDDLCFMLDSMGLTTGVDLERLLRVRDIVRAALPDIEMHGALARAGLPR